MLWQLVHPAENGGLGMSPDDAERLTIDRAEFFLMDEKTVRRGDAEIRKRLRERGVLHEPARMTGEEYLKKSREYYSPGLTTEEIIRRTREIEGKA